MLEQTTKYAISALIYLAHSASPEEYVQVKSISENTDVPAAYMSKVIKALAAAGLVETRRGMAGGVRLPAGRQLSLYDVCLALQDPVAVEHCFLSRRACDPKSPCPVHSKWKGERCRLVSFLKGSQISELRPSPAARKRSMR